MLIGAGDKYALGDVGGEETHTLTVDEMPEHRHLMYYAGSAAQSANHDYYTNASVTTWGNKWRVAGGTDTTGSNYPHNNMMPYKAVYMWERIA